MKRNRFSEEQIIGILKEHEAGVSVADLCRKHGVSDASIYKWKARFGGMEVSEAKRVRALEDENSKLKRMLADAIARQRRSEGPAGKEVVTPVKRHWNGPPDKRAIGTPLVMGWSGSDPVLEAPALVAGLDDVSDG